MENPEDQQTIISTHTHARKWKPNLEQARITHQTYYHPYNHPPAFQCPRSINFTYMWNANVEKQQESEWGVVGRVGIVELEN